MYNEKYDPFDQMTFTYDKCFLCGNELTSNNYSVEHIFPKWLQNKFDLWNQDLILLNGTQIKYRNLTIPCCKNCNTTMSKCIEKPVERAVEAGYEEFIRLDKKIVFQWLNKISYGMLFKELSLKQDIRNPHSPTIYNEEHLKQHHMQYMFLKSIIDGAEYIEKPYSLLIFRLRLEEEESRYWAADNPFLKTFFIRMNDIGIIAHLMDNGYQEGFFMEFPDMVELLNKELHPIQFAELCAKLLYKSSLFNRNPFFTIVFDKDKKLKNIIAHPLSGDAFDEWSQEDYARCLEVYWQKWGLKFDDIYKGNDLVITYLRNEDGTFKDFYN